MWVKLLRHKWLFAFLLGSMGFSALCIIPNINLVGRCINVRLEVLTEWYPHFGLLLFYFLKFLVPLRTILLAIAVIGLCYISVHSIYKIINSLKQRSLQFKLMTATLVALPFLPLYLLVSNFYKSPGIAAYNLNDSINSHNTPYSQNNSFGFTDKERPRSKPKGIFRIAVIGDSFIWGDGLPYEQVWSHKLERKLLAKYDSIEVLSWGRCGWSTLDEINFFKQHGKDYNIDLLIIGWVNNDPDVGKWPQIKVLDPAKEHPVIYQIYPALAQRLANSKEQAQVDKWFINLYSDENLHDYSMLLTEFRDYLAGQKIDAFFVMTPALLAAGQKEQYITVERIMNSVHFKCLNLFESTAEKFRNTPPSQLQANAVNLHPGALLTDEFATQVFHYLETNDYLQHVPGH